ncbi:MAG: hypothetical protein JW839_10205, partial [Candidatus Lokiarchaeota archaeon]|nr:hypothetical protein [Candidatus Lokiarchaeota archaeon]
PGMRPGWLAWLPVLVSTFVQLVCELSRLLAPGAGYISFGNGILMITLVVARHPKLMYILPFRAIRLTVMDTRSGIPLYNHSWRSDSDTENVDIYAGMFQGVNLFIKESLNKGDVQEIRTESAVIFAHRSTQYPVACIMVATRSSRVLRDALKTFAEKFYTRYGPHFSNTSESNAFESATGLVAESFPFVPDYSS